MTEAAEWGVVLSLGGGIGWWIVFWGGGSDRLDKPESREPDRPVNVCLRVCRDVLCLCSVFDFSFVFE